MTANFDFSKVYLASEEKFWSISIEFKRIQIKKFNPEANALSFVKLKINLIFWKIKIKRF